MSNDKQRDEMTDRLLRQTFGAGERPGAVTPECVGAEVMAAWVEGALGPSAARRVEAHLSSCERCQTVLATIAVAEPSLAAGRTTTAASFWHRWSMKWVAPVAAGLGAVMVWAVMRSGETVDPATSMARVESRESAPTSEMSAAQGRIEEQVQAPASPPAAGAAPSDSDLKALERRAAPIAAPVEPARRQDEAISEALSGRRSFQGLIQLPPAAAPPPPSTAAAAEVRSSVPGQPPNVQQSAERTVAVANERTAAQPQFVRGEPTFPGEVNVVAEFGVGVGATLGQASGRGAGAAADARQESSTPPRGVLRWRVLVNGRVERQILGSTTWTPVDLDSQTFVVGGASATTTTCWLIGRGGIVLRTIDGERFARVSLPAGVEPASIVSSSALEARLVATNGRVLTTTDGGATWR